jgi:hypothetical protein
VSCLRVSLPLLDPPWSKLERGATRYAPCLLLSAESTADGAQSEDI